MKVYLRLSIFYSYLEGGDGGGVDEDLSTVSSPPYPAWPGHHLFLKRGISQNHCWKYKKNTQRADFSLLITKSKGIKEKGERRLLE